jgi:hypothetical protein
MRIDRYPEKQERKGGESMNCPFCGTMMESGRVDTNAVFHIVRHPADITR